MSFARKSLSKKIRDQVKAKLYGRCGYCGQKSERLQIDHMTPVVRFWKEDKANEMENLIAACFPCNNLKGAYDVEQFRLQVSWQLGNANKYSVNYRTAKRFGQVAETPSPIVFYFERVK